ncbi:MAG TPA: helix-turn-helix domain-containing protein, partial [Anaerolineae bacterium]|nr:helix-turn-helix domain-containing protein [Anaerolineae bacterium]
MTHQIFQIRDKRTQRRFFIDNVIVRGYGWIIKAPGIAIYNALCLHADLEDQNCWPSQQLVADEIGVSLTTVKHYLRLLRELGLVGWQHRDEEGLGQTSNIYYLLDPPDPPAVTEFIYPDYMNMGPAANPHMGKEGRQDVPTPQATVAYPPGKTCLQTIPIEQSPLNMAPGGAGADAPAAPAAHLVRQEERYMGILVVIHYPEDLTFYCPACDEQQAWPSKRTNFACGKCKEPLVGFELGNFPTGQPDWRPSKRPIAERDKRVLGNLFRDCPAPLSTYPYFARDKVALKRVHSIARALLWEEIRFQAGKNLTNQCPRHQVVHNGMVATQNKLPMATRPKEENESQAERNAREATPVSEE